MKIHILLLMSFLSTRADIYFHNPRGSNNRLDEQGRERRNANRLFDSQNNNRGGYNVGSLYYYTGSKLAIEWTNQHSCATANNHCEFILQYMCGDNVRDGSTTTTIPENPIECEDYDCNTDTRYGMHESFDFYYKCQRRERNQGLYQINQKPREFAKNTRQNPKGTRRGYECPEERDYYPYWHPSPWKDIAVLTNNASRCPYYQSESENVKGRWECVIPREILFAPSGKNIRIPNNRVDCDAFRWPANSRNGTRARWVQAPAHNIERPECRETEYSRDNHNGNGLGGYPLLYNWTLPEDLHERCVMRIRYNISTAEYDAWLTNSTSNDKERLTRLDLSEKYSFPDRESAEKRGYRLVNKPQVQVFPGLPNLKLQLAINTAQYGRTFQDRSHTFAIRARPESLKDVVIHNLNVRGKRGNIVQVYPAVEYDFVPNTLRMAVNDWIHIQWTGSNSNPHNNDGQGQAGSDRSNVVLQRLQVYDEGSQVSYPDGKHGHWGRSYPELVQNSSFLGLPPGDLMNLALLTPNQFRGEMSELDDAGTYYDLGPRKVTKRGTYHYMCTRNNNFSNRSQKGKIVVSDVRCESKAIGKNGGTVSIAKGSKSARVMVEPGQFDRLQKLELEQWNAKQGDKKIKEKGRRNPVEGEYASEFVVLQPESRLAADDKVFTVHMSVDQNDVIVYRTSREFNVWTRVDADVTDGTARFDATHGGVYVAVSNTNVALIAGAVVAVAVLLAVLIGGTVVYFRCHPDKAAAIKRSFQGKV